MSTAYYPVSLSLRGRSAVVIGDGHLADEKVRALLAAGAHVRVISERPTTGIEALAATGRVELCRRRYRTGDLRGAFIAVAAPAHRTETTEIWREAEAERVLLNAVDDVPHCHFIAPAILRRGPVTVAISTGGASPALAVRLRTQVARVVRREHGRLASLLGAMREDVAQRVPDPERRKALWFALVDSRARAALARNRISRARRIVNRLISQAAGLNDRQGPVRARGTVTLVGGGPGRPGLITVDGLRALRRADAVLYDHLVHRSLIQAAPASARRIDAGKRPGGPRRSQAWINTTMIALARQGLRVVRLKGGDPFVFGRGAEECAALRAAGIAHRVVPGISAAIAAPGAAGIPVTHRERASAFVVVSAEQAGSAAPVDWRAVSSIPTVVVLMGVGKLASVVAELRGAGMEVDTPAAIVAKASLHDQRTIVGTLGTIVAQAASALLAPPATLVVGGVVREANPLVQTSEHFAVEGAAT